MLMPRALLTILLLALAPPLPAQQRPVLVELYTSQGCSACPAADALLGELAGREDVVALALHVDYWDYIGWKDSFAKPQFSARQRAYARRSGDNMVYTPQMVINGVDAVIGNRRRDVADLISRHQSEDGGVKLSARREGDRLEIRAEARPGWSGRALVQLVRFLPHARVEIARGENAGRVLEHTNVVVALDTVAEWDMNTPLDLGLPIAGPLPAVVLVQREENGRVEAVVRVLRVH